MKRALQDHPKREAIVKENSNITKSEAEARMREWKREQEGKRNSSQRKSEQEQWLRKVVTFVNDIKHTAAEMMKGEARALREIAEPELLATLLPKLREGSAALLSLADQLEHLNNEDLEGREAA